MVDQTQKDSRYKARQQKVKAEIDAKVASAQEEKGLFLIITGNGKGKSTSGFGTIARAVGSWSEMWRRPVYQRHLGLWRACPARTTRC